MSYTAPPLSAPVELESGYTAPALSTPVVLGADEVFIDGALAATLAVLALSLRPHPTLQSVRAECCASRQWRR